MTEEPLISIITPTYNHENFIGKCIESVIAQDYVNWEQIIIDDGSKDFTKQIVNKYQDNRIKYIKQRNKGIENLKETYNKALEISKGEIIAVLEGDDFWPPDKLSKQLKAFENPEVVLSWGNAAVTDKKGNIIELPILSSFRPNESLSYNLILKKLVLNNFIPACTVLCKKETLIKIGGFEQAEHSPCVDYSTWLNLAIEGKFYYLDELLGYWRRHGEQITSTKQKEMVKANQIYCLHFFNELPEHIKEIIGIDTKDIKKTIKNNLANVYFHEGRIALYECEWTKSKKNFINSFQDGNFPIKMKSIVGILFSYFKLNLEWVCKILHIPELKDLYYL